MIPNATHAADVPDAVKANVTFSVTGHTELTPTHTRAWVSECDYYKVGTDFSDT